MVLSENLRGSEVDKLDEAKVIQQNICILSQHVSLETERGHVLSGLISR
jgi:hypothetical protein